MRRKIPFLLSLLLFIFISFFLTGCKPKVDEEAIMKIEEVYKSIFANQDLKNVTQDIYLPTYFSEVLIEWKSDNPDILSDTGKVYSVTSEKIVILTAKLTHNKTSLEKYYGIIVRPNNNNQTDEVAIEKIQEAYLSLFPDTDLNDVTEDLDFPTYLLGVTIVWQSNYPEVISNSGIVFDVANDTNVTISAKMSYNQTVQNKLFSLVVKPRTTIPLNPQDKVNEVADGLLNGIDLLNLDSDLVLPTSISGVTIIWSTSDEEVISSTGIIHRAQIDKNATITAALSYLSATKTVGFNVTILGINLQLLPYYSGAEQLSGLVLKNFLHDVIDNHKTYNYDFAKVALPKTDEDPNNPNNIILFYTGRSQAKSTYNTGNDGWNREHVWAKSHGGFGETIPAGSDLHHLRPTDATVNSTRSNLDFDNGGKKVNDTFAEGSTFCYYDSDSFEPRDEVKGDVARIIFYMAVRYDGSDGVKDLELNDNVNNGTNPFMGRLSVLLIWNEFDPVDDFESNRNEVIFGYQENRNPFIDHPHFANLIWGVQASNVSNGLESQITIIKIQLNLEIFRKQQYC